MKLKALISTVVLALVLTACGGGSKSETLPDFQKRCEKSQGEIRYWAQSSGQFADCLSGHRTLETFTWAKAGKDGRSLHPDGHGGWKPCEHADYNGTLPGSVCLDAETEDVK